MKVLEKIRNKRGNWRALMFTACTAEFLSLSRWCFWFYAPHIPAENKSFALKMHPELMLLSAWFCSRERISLLQRWPTFDLTRRLANKGRIWNVLHSIFFCSSPLLHQLSRMHKCSDRRKSRRTLWAHTALQFIRFLIFSPIVTILKLFYLKYPN